MEEKFIKCPKCEGAGKKGYIYFHVGDILENLSLLKKGNAIETLDHSARLIRIICPLCEGHGEVDWISWPIRQNFNKPFSSLEGCLDIFLDLIPVYQWFSNPPDRNGLEIFNDLSEYSNPEKIIKLAQNRYDEPIKLNNDFLSMTADELKRIAGILNWHHLEVSKPYTEEKLLEYLKKHDLIKYKPDKFAYPEPNDMDEIFY